MHRFQNRISNCNSHVAIFSNEIFVTTNPTPVNYPGDNNCKG